MKGFKITGVSYIYFIGTFYQSIDLNKMDSFILKLPVTLRQGNA